MSKNWLNQTIRLLLVIVGLYAIGSFGFTIGEGFAPYFLGIVLPAICLVSWWVFRYPNDPRKNPVIPIGGKLRIAMELVFFAAAIYAFQEIGHNDWSKYLLYGVLLHYVVSYDRLISLWTNQPL
jgi:hypothetical protein